MKQIPFLNIPRLLSIPDIIGNRRMQNKFNPLKKIEGTCAFRPLCHSGTVHSEW